MTNEQKRKQITTLFGAYSKRLEKLYDDFIMQLSRLAIKTHVSVKDMLTQDPLFHFSDFPEIREEYNRIFSDYVQKEMLAYRAGITDGVALAYTHDNSVLTGFSILSDEALRSARKTAAETFLRTRMRTTMGLNLSQLVWNYASQTKSEFEVAISNVLADGLKRGTSAADLARKVRQYLNNPDMMYRRYHRTVIDAHGNKKDIVRWRRRVVDEQGRVRFVEAPLEKVGMGQYRSSRKNSERLMRTEINMSYHHANSERWKNEPFVIGIVIDLSPQHPEYDMCDDLAGRYPKDFVFIGWHPQCLCMANPITLQGEEKKEFYRRLMAGEDMSNYVSPHAVIDIPDNAKQWIANNRDKFISAGERGKLGYVWRENFKYIRPQFTKEQQQRMGIAAQPKRRVKTAEEKAAIQARRDERRANNAFKQEVRSLYNEARDIPYFEREMLKQIATAYKANDIATLRSMWPVFEKRARYELSITPKELMLSNLNHQIGMIDSMRLKGWSKKWLNESAEMRLRLFGGEVKDMSNGRLLRMFAEKEVRRATDELARKETIGEFLNMNRLLTKYGVKYTHPIEYQELIDLPLMQKEVKRIKPYFLMAERIERIEKYVMGMSERTRGISAVGKLYNGIKYDITANGLRPYDKGLFDMVADAEKNIARLEREAQNRALKKGSLVEGQFRVQLNKISLSDFSWKSVDDVDIKSVLTKFFDANDGLLYNGTFNKLTVSDGSAFMAHNNHQWFDRANGAKAKHEFFVYTRTHPTSGNFNAYNDLRSALFKVARKEALTFNEEYALESIWHEIWHGRAKGWSYAEYKKAKGVYRDSMETINQFLARRSYDNFMKAIGGTAKHSAKVYAEGYGYRGYERNFNKLLAELKIPEKDVIEHFKEFLLNNQYQDIRGELASFIGKKTGRKSGVKKLVDSMFDSNSVFESELRKFR